MFDVGAKYVVLFLFAIYIGRFIEFYMATGQQYNMPDWLVMIFTLVFQYFFRRSPKEGAKNEQANNGSQK